MSYHTEHGEDDSRTASERMHASPHSPPELTEDQKPIYCTIDLEGVKFIVKCEFHRPIDTDYPGYLDVQGIHIGNGKQRSNNLYDYLNPWAISEIDELAWEKCLAGEFFSQSEEEIPVWNHTCSLTMAPTTA